MVDEFGNYPRWRCGVYICVRVGVTLGRSKSGEDVSEKKGCCLEVHVIVEKGEVYHTHRHKDILIHNYVYVL